MQIGLVAVGDQGANVVGAVSKTNVACKMGGVGRGQGQHVMNAHCVFLPGQRVPRMSGGNDVKVGIGLDKRRFHNHNSVKEAPVLRLSDAREGVEIKPNRR